MPFWKIYVISNHIVSFLDSLIKISLGAVSRECNEVERSCDIIAVSVAQEQCRIWAYK